MGELISGDDGLPAEDVGFWAKEKHELLCRYIDISRATRSKYIGPHRGGAIYIDPFCGPGRACIRNSGEWIDGGCVAAWKQSQKSGAPFSAVYIGDIDSIRLKAAGDRLRQLGAPVKEFSGSACDTSRLIAATLQKNAPSGLHLAFLDPFNLAALDFEIIRSLGGLKRIDMIVHVNKMDLQRNLEIYLSSERSPFDLFAPGWRDSVDVAQSLTNVRLAIFEHWRTLISSLGAWASSDVRLITGSKNQPLYWLLVAAKHDLAHRFWESTTKTNQHDLFS